MVQLPPLGSGRSTPNGQSADASGRSVKRPGSTPPSGFDQICSSIPATVAEPPDLVSKLLQKSRDIAMPNRVEEPPGRCARACPRPPAPARALNCPRALLRAPTGVDGPFAPRKSIRSSYSAGNPSGRPGSARPGSASSARSGAGPDLTAVMAGPPAWWLGSGRESPATGIAGREAKHTSVYRQFTERAEMLLATIDESVMNSTIASHIQGRTQMIDVATFWDAWEGEIPPEGAMVLPPIPHPPSPGILQVHAGTGWFWLLLTAALLRAAIQPEWRPYSGPFFNVGRVHPDSLPLTFRLVVRNRTQRTLLVEASTADFPIGMASIVYNDTPMAPGISQDMILTIDPTKVSCTKRMQRRRRRRRLRLVGSCRVLFQLDLPPSNSHARAGTLNGCACCCPGRPGGWRGAGRRGNHLRRHDDAAGVAGWWC